MGRRSKFLLALSVTLIAVAPQCLKADRIVCESRNDGKNYCDMDTRGGVRIHRNLSKTDCIEGRNWGWGYRGVWVDDGCRAVFVSADDAYRGRYDFRGDDYHNQYDYRGDYWRREPPRCPPGTRPNNHRCSNEERRRGCKDYNMGEGRPACSNFGP